jgi:LysM repeat protein
VSSRGRTTLARYAAPAAFLVAATIAVLIVRSGLSNGDETVPPGATATTTAAATTGPAPPTTTGRTTTAAASQFYVIEAGDTLAVIADRFDTTVEQLLVLNPEVDPVSLTIGQRIRVK